MNFEVNVWTRRTATVSHERNNVTTANHVTDFDAIFLVMGITRDHTISVCDLNHFTVARTLAAPADNTTGHRDDLCTLASCEIDAFMPRFFPT